MNAYAVIISAPVTGTEPVTAGQLNALTVSLGRGNAAYDSSTRELRVTTHADAPTVDDAMRQVQADVERAAAIAGIRLDDRDELRAVSWERFEAEALRPSTPRGGLAGVAEVAEILGVSRARVYQLAKDHPDFPDPVADLAAGPVWDRAEVEAFERNWGRKRTGRPRKDQA